MFNEIKRAHALRQICLGMGNIRGYHKKGEPGRKRRQSREGRKCLVGVHDSFLKCPSQDTKKVQNSKKISITIKKLVSSPLFLHPLFQLKEQWVMKCKIYIQNVIRFSTDVFLTGLEKASQLPCNLEVLY